MLVATFLLNKLKENETYWISKYFLNKLRVKDLLKDGFPKLNLINYQF